MKKILTILLVALMAVTMFGCGPEEEPEKSKRQIAEELGKLLLLTL